MATLQLISRQRLLLPICIGVLCIILTLGLWPFHSPRNDVAWLGNHNGLCFGKYSTVISSALFPVAPITGREATIEIWLQPKRIWGSGVLLAFYTPENLSQFSLRQSLTDLLLQTEGAKLYVSDVFRRHGSVFITITSSKQGTRIYIDGVLTASTSQFPLPAAGFTGWLVLGDAPGQTDSWAGQMFGLAIYRCELRPKQVFQNYIAWKQTGRPEIDEDGHTFALYLFNEQAGNLVRDKGPSAVNLYIPETYKVMGKITLEPFWREFSVSRSYLGAVFKNIIGFVPFGFCFYAWLSMRLPVQRATLLTVVLGTAVSLTIEILQAFLPTRDSGTTDLITNTLGTWSGVALYRVAIVKHRLDRS